MRMNFTETTKTETSSPVKGFVTIRVTNKTTLRVISET